jgi:hypothetical protein
MQLWRSKIKSKGEKQVLMGNHTIPYREVTIYRNCRSVHSVAVLDLQTLVLLKIIFLDFIVIYILNLFLV